MSARPATVRAGGPGVVQRATSPMLAAMPIARRRCWRNARAAAFILLEWPGLLADAARRKFFGPVGQSSAQEAPEIAKTHVNLGFDWAGLFRLLREGGSQMVLPQWV